MPEPASAQGGAPAEAANTPKAASAPVNSQEVDSFILRLQARHGSTENALRQLAKEQLKYRQRAKDAEAVAEDLRKKVPTAGSVVLSAEDGKIYQEITKSGVKIADLPALLKEHGELKTKDSLRSQEDALAEAAGTKYKANVLKRLLPVDAKLSTEKEKVRGKDKDGKATIEEHGVPYITIGTKRERLDEYVERELSDFMDMLVAEESESTNRQQQSSTTSNGGVTVPRQQSIGDRRKPEQKQTTTVVDNTLSSRYQTPSQRRKATSESA